MQRFIDLTPAEKNELFLRTYSAMKIEPILLEKDFWVSWLLNKVFQMDMSKDLIFKGGTSLSKCYGLIQRFSEDIDITIDKSIFSSGIIDTELSGKQFQKLLKANDQKAIEFVKGKFQQTLIALIQNDLPYKETWQLAPDEIEPKNLRFYYPAAIKADSSSYIKQSILIEIGVRGDISPCEEKTVTSYVDAQFNTLLESEQVGIKTLSPVRTFWEKITLLHAENYRPEDKTHGDRLSRHYYDVHQMIKAGIGEKALKDMSLLQDVIQNKKKYFASSWANYDSAVPGTMMIAPNDRLLPHLESDYKAMRSMIFGQIPTLNEILYSIKEFENLVNE